MTVALYVFAAIGLLSTLLFAAGFVAFVVVGAVDARMDASSGGRQQ